MTISKDDVIREESCLKCVHSLERTGKIVCGDRGLLVRMLAGLRQIDNPNIARCNRFDGIPQDITKNCKYCEHFGVHHDRTVCWNADWLTLLLSGPVFQVATNKCDKFELAARYKQRTFIPEKKR